MSKLESLKNEKFALSTQDLSDTVGGAKPGHHRFLWMTWETSVNTWETEDGAGNTVTYEQVSRCSDGK